MFNRANALHLIARAHRLVHEGYEYVFGKQLVTIWSSTNYCYYCGGMVSILKVNEDRSRHFTVYSAAPGNKNDKGWKKKQKYDCFMAPISNSQALADAPVDTQVFYMISAS